jgi:hypothetical protein
MMEEVAGWIDVLNVDEVKVKTLTPKCEEHRDEDEKQCAFWSEVKTISIDCFAHAHRKRDYED